MKYKIVLIPYPFDDFSEKKVRPSLCLTNPISKHRQIILAPITSNIVNATEVTDLILKDDSLGFERTGLKTSSVIKLHRLITVSEDFILKIIGFLPDTYYDDVSKKIKLLFEFK